MFDFFIGLSAITQDRLVGYKKGDSQLGTQRYLTQDQMLKNYQNLLTFLKYLYPVLS